MYTSLSMLGIGDKIRQICKHTRLGSVRLIRVSSRTDTFHIIDIDICQAVHSVRVLVQFHNEFVC